MLANMRVTDRAVSERGEGLVVAADLPIRDGSNVVNFKVYTHLDADMTTLACQGSFCKYKFRAFLLVTDPITGDVVLASKGRWQDGFVSNVGDRERGRAGTLDVHNQLLNYVTTQVAGSYNNNSEAIDRAILFGHRMIKLGYRPYVSERSDTLPVSWRAVDPTYAFTTFKYQDKLILSFRVEDAGGRPARITIIGTCLDSAVDCRDLQAAALSAIPRELRQPGALATRSGFNSFSVMLDYMSQAMAGASNAPSTFDVLENVALPVAKKVKAATDLNLSRSDEIAT